MKYGQVCGNIDDKKAEHRRWCGIGLEQGQGTKIERRIMMLVTCNFVLDERIEQRAWNSIIHIA